MENPETWGTLEKTISAALIQADLAMSQGFIGLSRVRQIADALREEGLIKE